MRLGYIQTDDTHLELGWGGANVGLQHLGCLLNFSEVLSMCCFLHVLQFFFWCFGAHRT